MEEIEKKY